jgi:hypothetical protein
MLSSLSKLSTPHHTIFHTKNPEAVGGALKTKSFLCVWRKDI